MKIKQTRQVRLDELVTYIIKNEVISSVFVSNRGNKTIVDTKGNFSNFGVFNQSDLFTITEEVEITEDTPLNLVVVDDENEVTDENETKISSLKRDAETWGYEIKFIYLQNPDGSIGELIWKDGELVD